MRAMIGLGSNVGDRLAFLRSAAAQLAAGAIPRTRVRACSRIYETRPVGPSKDPYLNAAMTLETELSASQLLRGLKQIENAHGRVRDERWGPRTLDLDFLVLFEEQESVALRADGLTLPHPEVFVRDFVMRPLLDLDPDLRVGGVSIAARLEALPSAEQSVLRVLEEGLLPD